VALARGDTRRRRASDRGNPDDRLHLLDAGRDVEIVAVLRSSDHALDPGDYFRDTTRKGGAEEASADALEPNDVAAGREESFGDTLEGGEPGPRHTLPTTDGG
jgi:hypothetical protein